MKLPNGLALIQSEDVLPDPSAVEGRIILWLRGERTDNYQYWDRISSLVHGRTIKHARLISIEATSTPTRQWTGGMIAKLFRRRDSNRESRIWSLPNGFSAEQCDVRRKDLLFAWSEHIEIPIDEDQVRETWPECTDVRIISDGLYLISGIKPAASDQANVLELNTASSHTPVQLAENELKVARARGDQQKECLALADLGLAFLRNGEAERAGPILDQALEKARKLGNGEMTRSIMVDQCLVALIGGQPNRAREIGEPILAQVRSIGDHPFEKLVLDRIGEAHSHQGDHLGAIAHFRMASTIAAGLGDDHHEADLQWRIAVQYDAMGEHEHAITHAEAAVRLMKRAGNPQLEWYRHHLKEFTSGLIESQRLGSNPTGPAYQFANTVDTSHPSPQESSPVRGNAGPLRMALTAGEAMAKFVGSGFKTVTSEVYRERIGLCSSCEQHTGLRCRACGCFTAAKARLQHERCPIGHWPT